MLRWNPKEAYAYWEKVRSVSKNSVTVHGLDYFLYRAWSSSLNDVVGIADVRRASLRCAENDEIIMGLAICSAELGTDATLLGFCKELLTSKLSKDRALAVSALAWLWQDPVDGLLTELRDADPCCWVREHAKWALQVRRQDSACRRSYRRALETTDEYEVSRELNIMKSALLPSCVVWRDLEEKAAGFPAPDCSRRKEALVRHFWSHWDSVTNHRQDTQVLGRRIKQYQRGHKVDSQTEGLMAPWWKP
jgi:hypothetical protein